MPGKLFGKMATPGSKSKMPGYMGNEEGRSSPQWFRGRQVSMKTRKARMRRMHMTGKGGKGVFEAQK